MRMVNIIFLLIFFCYSNSAKRRIKKLSGFTAPAHNFFLKNEDVLPSDALSKYASSVQKSGVIVCVTVSSTFLPAMVNWMVLMYRLEIKNILILAMDPESFNFFHERGLKVYLAESLFSPSSKEEEEKVGRKGETFLRRHQIWDGRVRVFVHLLKLGFTIISSDSDALWLKNPIPELVALQKDFDIVWSRGNAAAGDHAHGNGVCMGFAVYKPTDNVIAILREGLHVMKEHYIPDQPAINSIIWGPHGINRGTDPYLTTLYKTTYNNARIALLPQTRFARHIGAALEGLDQSIIDLYVFHGADEGWNISFKYLPPIVPRLLYFNITGREYDPQLHVKEICAPAKWSPRPNFSPRDIAVQKCLGLWMLRKNWNAPLPTPESSFEDWLEHVSYLAILRGKN